MLPAGSAAQASGSRGTRKILSKEKNSETSQGIELSFGRSARRDDRRPCADGRHRRDQGRRSQPDGHRDLQGCLVARRVPAQAHPHGVHPGAHPGGQRGRARVRHGQHDAGHHGGLRHWHVRWHQVRELAHGRHDDPLSVGDGGTRRFRHPHHRRFEGQADSARPRRRAAVPLPLCGHPRQRRSHVRRRRAGAGGVVPRRLERLQAGQGRRCTHRRRLGDHEGDERHHPRRHSLHPLRRLAGRR